MSRAQCFSPCHILLIGRSDIRLVAHAEEQSLEKKHALSADTNSLSIKCQKLPLEIVECIIEQTTDKSTLCSWALVSKFCMKATVRPLYRSIVVPGKNLPSFNCSLDLVNDRFGGPSLAYKAKKERKAFGPNYKIETEIDEKLKALAPTCRAYYKLLYMLVSSLEYAPADRKNRFIQHLEFDAHQTFPTKCMSRTCPCRARDRASLTIHDALIMCRVRMLKKLFVRLPNLRSLKVEGFPLTTSLWDRIANAMPKLEELEYNYVANWISDQERTPTENGSFFHTPKRLKRLILAGVTFEVDIFGTQLFDLSKLEEFMIWGKYHDWSIDFARELGVRGLPKSLKKVNMTGFLLPLASFAQQISPPCRPHELVDVFRHCAPNLTHLILRHYPLLEARSLAVDTLHQKEREFFDLCHFPSLTHVSFGLLKYMHLQRRNGSAMHGAFHDKEIHLPFILNGFLETHGEKLKALHLHNLMLPAKAVSNNKDAATRFYDALANCKALEEYTWGCHAKRVAGIEVSNYYASTAVKMNLFDQTLHKFFFPSLQEYEDAKLWESIANEKVSSLEPRNCFTNPTKELSLLHTIRSFPALQRLKVSYPWDLNTESKKRCPDCFLSLMKISPDDFAQTFVGSKLRILILWDNAATERNVRHLQPAQALSATEYYLGAPSTDPRRPTHKLSESKGTISASTSRVKQLHSPNVYEFVLAIVHTVPTLTVITHMDLRFHVQRTDEGEVEELWNLADALEAGVVSESSLSEEEWKFLGKGKKLIEAKQDECCDGMFSMVWGGNATQL